ncbi:hypothetical protein tinsulaeT_00110 [Thalassotalea insulae]|uniref:DUF1795 domain-containing protein n=1 Tax=Thalassotalea insulae TaxID=2056778 RepID=A0ABQ6GR95_9GAMM|nr:hypothetical protein [Thalassotalea insulae]GLX76671.1 hypothetical protein tinsulaeT_00110 [Thalassotalea insulae]
MYQHDGVCFEFPELWEVTDDDGDEIIRAINIECPNDGYYSIDIYNLEQAPSLESYIERSLKYFINELPFHCKIKGQPIREIEHAVNQNTETEGLKLKFTVRAFFILKIGYINSYFRVVSGNKVSFISSQYPNESAVESEDGFNKILSSYTIV